MKYHFNIDLCTLHPSDIDVTSDTMTAFLMKRLYQRIIFINLCQILADSKLLDIVLFILNTAVDITAML